MATRLQAGNAALANRTKAAEDEAARLAKVKDQLDQFRAEEFWDPSCRK